MEELEDKDKSHLTNIDPNFYVANDEGQDISEVDVINIPELDYDKDFHLMDEEEGYPEDPHSRSEEHQSGISNANNEMSISMLSQTTHVVEHLTKDLDRRQLQDTTTAEVTLVEDPVPKKTNPVLVDYVSSSDSEVEDSLPPAKRSNKYITLTDSEDEDKPSPTTVETSEDALRNCEISNLTFENETKHLKDPYCKKAAKEIQVEKRSLQETDHIETPKLNSSFTQDNSQISSDVKEAFEKGHIVEDKVVAKSMFYKCTICFNSLSGLIPVQNHIRGAKHRKFSSRKTSKDLEKTSTEELPEESKDLEDLTCDKIETIKLSIPKDKCTTINGEGGAKLLLICMQSKAEITLDNSTKSAKQGFYNIKGTKKQIEMARQLIFDKVGVNSLENELIEGNSQESDVEKALEAGYIAHDPGSKTNPYVCKICSTLHSGLQSLQQHLDGTKHKKKVADSQESDVKEALRAGYIAHDPGSTPNPYLCKICKTKLSGRQSLQQHLNGATHKKKAAANDIYSRTKSTNSWEDGQTEAVSQDPDVTEAFKAGHVVDGKRVVISPYHCILCLIPINGLEDLQNHLRGAKHMKNAAGDKALSITMTTMSQEPEVKKAIDAGHILVNQESTDSPYLCKICLTHLSGLPSLYEHVKGAKHIKKAAASVTTSGKSSMNSLEDDPTESTSQDSDVKEAIQAGHILEFQKYTISTFYCKLCSSQISGPITLQEHLKGAKHKTNAADKGFTKSTEPTQAKGNAEPTQARGNTEPTQARGNAEPTQAKGNIEPTQARGNTEPTQARGNTRPTQARGNTRPSQARSNTRPTQSRGNTGPGVVCQFFLRGNCHFQDNCRNLHVNNPKNETATTKNGLAAAAMAWDKKNELGDKIDQAASEKSQEGLTAAVMTWAKNNQLGDNIGLIGAKNNQLGDNIGLIGKATTENSQGLINADYWTCTRCGKVNRAHRFTCNKCNAVSEVLQRFNERKGYQRKVRTNFNQERKDDNEERSRCLTERDRMSNNIRDFESINPDQTHLSYERFPKRSHQSESISPDRIYGKRLRSESQESIEIVHRNPDRSHLIYERNPNISENPDSIENINRGIETPSNLWPNSLSVEDACQLMMSVCDLIGVLGPSLRIAIENTNKFRNDHSKILDTLSDIDNQELLNLVAKRLNKLKNETHDNDLRTIFSLAYKANNFLLETTKSHLEKFRLNTSQLLWKIEEKILKTKSAVHSNLKY